MAGGARRPRRREPGADLAAQHGKPAHAPGSGPGDVRPRCACRPRTISSSPATTPTWSSSRTARPPGRTVEARVRAGAKYGLPRAGLLRLPKDILSLNRRHCVSCFWTRHGSRPGLRPLLADGRPLGRPAGVHRDGRFTSRLGDWLLGAYRGEFRLPLGAAYVARRTGTTRGACRSSGTRTKHRAKRGIQGGRRTGSAMRYDRRRRGEVKTTSGRPRYNPKALREARYRGSRQTAPAAPSRYRSLALTTTAERPGDDGESSYLTKGSNT